MQNETTQVTAQKDAVLTTQTEEPVGKNSSEKTTKTDQTTEQPSSQPTYEEILEGLERDEDGRFVFRVSDHTVYKGSSLKELLENARKGFAEKDKTIIELKTKTAQNRVREAPKATEGTTIEPPSYEDTLNEVVRELNIDPRMLTWTKEQWREYELENGAVFAAKEFNRVELAQQLARQRLDEKNIAYINNLTLEEETEEVRQLLKEFGVDPSEFDYEKVLDVVWNDETAWKKNGVRKNGVIVRTAAKVIRDIAKAKIEKQVSAKKDEEIAKSRLQKAGLVTEGATRTKPEITTKPAESIRSAHEAFLRELRIRGG